MHSTSSLFRLSKVCFGNQHLPGVRDQNTIEDNEVLHRRTAGGGLSSGFRCYMTSSFLKKKCCEAHKNAFKD